MEALVMRRFLTLCVLVGVVFAADLCRPYLPDFAKSVVVPLAKTYAYVIAGVGG